MSSTGFTRPSRDQCIAAIGITTPPPPARATRASGSIPKLDADERKIFWPDPEIFQPVAEPASDDWLANHHEEGQTVSEFARSRRNIPDKVRCKIHLLPLTFFEKAVPVDIQASLAEYASYFFGMPVDILNPQGFAGKVSSRVNQYTGLKQVHAGEILVEMRKCTPKDSFCMGALSLCDLYPKDSWNFVFGLANLSTRVGVYSLARHMPGFFKGEEPDTMKMTGQEKAELLKQSCSLMCHEMCHMFGMKHCIFFHCLMNGSNHMEESSAKPLYLCPVCLRKLHMSCKFNILERYSQMQDFCQRHGLEDHGLWLEKRVQMIIN